MMTPDEIQAEFDKRNPWYWGFRIDGRVYGGGYTIEQDIRLDQFFDYFPRPSTILELGSHEGGSTCFLARHYHVKRLVAIEARPVNIEKAKFVEGLLGIRNVEHVEANLEALDLASLGTFDVVLCAGVLYHMPKPWELLERISQVTNNLFLCTHFIDEAKVNVRNGDYFGWTFKEGGWDDQLSGVSPYSFWTTPSTLLKMLIQFGFKTIHILEMNVAAKNGAHITLAATKT